MITMTQAQALDLVEKAHRAGYAMALANVHALIGSHMQHCDSVDEARLLDALGRAVYEMLRATVKC